jgi:outer membrane protein TolC
LLRLPLQSKHREAPAVDDCVTVARVGYKQAIAVGGIFPQSQQVGGLYPSGTFANNPAHIDFTGFNLAWELDFWGKYRRQVESDNAMLDASEPVNQSWARV